MSTEYPSIINELIGLRVGSMVYLIQVREECSHEALGRSHQCGRHMGAVKNDSEDAKNFSSHHNDNGDFWLWRAVILAQEMKKKIWKLLKHNGPVNSDNRYMRSLWRWEILILRVLDQFFQ
ncbi:hypothetical protein L1049_001233 [Liquidambar formosana]|uniref:Uncharacterized protein n=1 Tax=Liquidambar formosana TaxID=63359 RepID=A0AAP0R5Z5_LIQFO